MTHNIHRKDHIFGSYMCLFIDFSGFYILFHHRRTRYTSINQLHKLHLMHLLQTTMWTATVYDHFGISLEYINLRHCHRLSHRLKIVLLRHYRCLRRSRMISKVSHESSYRIVATAEEYHTQSLYTNSSDSILVHRRTRLRDAYTRAPYIAHLLLFVEYWILRAIAWGRDTWWYCFILYVLLQMDTLKLGSLVLSSSNKLALLSCFTAQVS